MRLRTPAPLWVGFALAATATFASAGELVAVRAGHLHLVEGGQVLRDGTILIDDGRIVAIGSQVAIPRGARVVDYGEDAHVGPGLVAADSSYGRMSPAERCAEPGLLAIDHFDAYSSYVGALANGITSVYLAPARGRLIAGQGAVVKTWGEDDARDERVLSSSTGLHGSISAEARNQQGYWRPPVPATVDVGMGVELPQLPRSTMGAVVALEELLNLARTGAGEELYGPYAGPLLAAHIEAGGAWRLGAETLEEVRALLEFFGAQDLKLIVDSGYGGAGAVDLAAELALAKVPVLLSPMRRGTDDFGGADDDDWARLEVAAKLAEAGVPFAITPGRRAQTSDLRFAALLAMRGGLDSEAALRAITLAPAEILGVADRVGSLAPGKDADLAVFNGAPMTAGTSLSAVWVDGEVAWKAHEVEATVVSVDELHVGDGTVLAPGELLMRGGKIVEVGRRVGRPAGATIVRGAAAMPGMIDAFGHLGLEGSRKSFSTRFDLTRIVEAGDDVDRRVARAGVTTVNLASRSDPGKSGAPLMAYKPAADSVGRAIVAHPSAMHFSWEERIRHQSGEDVREALAKAAEYKQKWEEYEKELAAWTPPAPEDDKASDKQDEEADEGDGDEKKDDEKDGDDDKDSKKKSKKKDKDAPALPVTGVWEGEVELEASEAEAFVRLRLSEEDGRIEGNLRCDLLSSTLVQLEGERAEKVVELTGLGSNGPLELRVELDGDEFEGVARVAGVEYEVEAKQTSTEYVVARRSEKRPTPEPPKVKGEPRSPGITPDLEPLRQAMMGKGCILVTVSRPDEILECVAAFESYGIRPVLYGASGALGVLSKLKGRIAGILLTGPATANAGGTKVLNRFAAIAEAGIPVAFQSQAEEGAVELPLVAAYAVANGMSPQRALGALTADAADMLGIANRVGRLAAGKDADVLLLDGDPLELSSSVVRTWVAGREIR